MKRLFFIFVAVLGIMLTGCTEKPKDTTPKAIGLNITDVVETKSAPITSTSIKSAPYGDFYTECWEHGATGARYYERSLATFATSSWTTGQFWPDDRDQALDFWSYAPSAAFEGVTLTPASNHQSVQFDYYPVHDEVSRNDAADQHDVIMAYTADQTWTYNYLVPVAFSHALSAIRFRVGELDSELESPSTVRIKGISLTGFYHGGHCTATATSTGSGDQVNYVWNTSGFPTGNYIQNLSGTSYAVTGQYFDSFSTDAAVMGEPIFMIVPQTTPTGAGLSIDWEMDGVQYSARDESFASALTFEPGKIYTFTLGLNHRDKKVEVLLTSIIDWDKVTTAIDFSHTVTGSSMLSFHDCHVDATSKLVTFDGITPVRCRFKLTEPAGSTFLVRLKGDFDAFTVNYSSDQTIDGETVSEFQLVPRLAAPERDYRVKMQISVRTADGRVINADDIVQGSNPSEYYTIVLPRAI